MLGKTRVSGAAVFAAALLAPAGTARAQVSSGNEKVTAEALFEDARGLVAQGRYAEACPKFADSERLDPSPATVLNLANCWEKAGRTATAWATYMEAASLANAVGRKDYLAAAQRHADALAPKLARLTVSVQEPVEGMQVRRDGVLVDRAEWGAPLPIDTGSHAIDASAPGHKAWALRVEVTQDASSATVTVPALEAAPVEASPPSSPTAQPAGLSFPAVSPVSPPADTGAQNGGSQRTVGLVLAGLGVVGLGVATGFAVSAKSKYNDSLANCQQPPGNHDLCDAEGVTQRNDARSRGDVATVLFGVGAAALVGGGVLWLTAPRAPAGGKGLALLVLEPTLGGAIVKGAW
jgi:serine/threonine-protein kinase